ncbi:hypothetical protein ACNQ17_00775 [Mycoplasma sp. Sp48II]|uniref:hypothetical protein n=1 Tax=Mycoplasma sp. Sp48II TaxID=3401682 RepID=UPI003AB014A5
MARILYTDPRDYREPFLLIKIKKATNMGMLETDTQGETFYSKLVFASIMQQKQAQVEAEGRSENDTLSIKFRKTELNIEVGDFVYRDKKIYTITSIDKDLFNLQEQKIVATYFKNIDAMPNLKKYLDNLAPEDKNKANQLLLHNAEDVKEKLGNLDKKVKQMNSSLDNFSRDFDSLYKTVNEFSDFANLVWEMNSTLNKIQQTMVSKTDIEKLKEELKQGK